MALNSWHQTDNYQTVIMQLLEIGEPQHAILAKGLRDKYSMESVNSSRTIQITVEWTSLRKCIRIDLIALLRSYSGPCSGLIEIQV